MIMLLKGLAEKVSPLGISDEVKIVRGKWVERGAKRGFAGIGYRAGRQAFDLIRVVR